MHDRELLCSSLQITRYNALPDLPELLTELKLDSFQELGYGVAFPDHNFPAMSSAVPVAVGDLKGLILHNLSAIQQAVSTQKGEWAGI